jgi:uncharacterized membrane protein YgcG
MLSNANCRRGSTLETEVLSAISALGREELRPFEIPLGVVIEVEPWTPASGLVTGTFKLRRPCLERKYKAAITALYCDLTADFNGDGDGDGDSAGAGAGDDVGAGDDDGGTSSGAAAAAAGLRQLGVAANSGGTTGENLSGVETSLAALAMQQLPTLRQSSASVLVVADVITTPLQDMLQDSLSAMRMVNAINRTFSTSFPVTVVLEADATLAHIATLIFAGRGSGSGGGGSSGGGGNGGKAQSSSGARERWIDFEVGGATGAKRSVHSSFSLND